MTRTMLLRSVFLFGTLFLYTVFAKFDGRQTVRNSASSDTDNGVQGKQHFCLVLDDFLICVSSCPIKLIRNFNLCEFSLMLDQHPFMHVQ